MIYAFDLDSTLTQVETLPYLAKKLNMLEEYEEVCNEIKKMSYEEGLVKRLELFNDEPSRGVSVVLGNAPIYKGLREFICKNREKCCIITSNLDYYIKKLTKQFHCHVYATPFHNFKTVRAIIDKAKIVEKLKQNDKVCYTGDGLNDVEAIKLADVSIAAAYAHDAPAEVKEAASFVAYSEMEALSFIGALPQTPQGRCP